jgi:hypothetical protein
MGTWLICTYICQFLFMYDVFYLRKEAVTFETLCVCVCVCTMEIHELCFSDAQSAAMPRNFVTSCKVT